VYGKVLAAICAFEKTQLGIMVNTRSIRVGIPLEKIEKNLKISSSFIKTGSLPLYSRQLH